MLDFIYDGQMLSNFGYMIGSFDGSVDDTLSLGNSLTFNTVNSVGTDKFNLINSKYEEPITYTMQICKKVCSGFDSFVISDKEMRKLLRWLCRKQNFYLQPIDDEGNKKQILFKGSFNNPQMILRGGEVYGLEITFNADAPYGYGLYEFNNWNETKSFGIATDSDEIGYIYPTMLEIQVLESGDLTLTNIAESRETVVKNCVSGETIYINGDKKIIISNTATHLIHNDFNYNYPRLVTTYEEDYNQFTTSLKTNVKLGYYPIRKVGLY